MANKLKYLILILLLPSVSWGFVGGGFVVKSLDDFYRYYKSVNIAKIGLSKGKFTHLMRIRPYDMKLFKTLSTHQKMRIHAELAAKDGYILYTKQGYYINKFQNIKNGDKRFFDCLKIQSCNLERYSRFIDLNGRLRPNHIYANKYVPLQKLVKNNIELINKYRYPIYFNKYGYPDFSQYARQTITSTKLTGSAIDNNIANNIMRQRIPVWKQPSGFTWHHHQDAKTMQLIPTDLHSAVRHSGGGLRLRSYN